MHEDLRIHVQVESTIELGPDGGRLVITEGHSQGTLTGRFCGTTIRRAGETVGQLRGSVETADGAVIHFVAGPEAIEETEHGFALHLRPHAPVAKAA